MKEKKKKRVEMIKNPEEYGVGVDAFACASSALASIEGEGLCRFWHPITIQPNAAILITKNFWTQIEFYLLLSS